MASLSILEGVGEGEARSLLPGDPTSVRSAPLGALAEELLVRAPEALALQGDAPFRQRALSALVATRRPLPPLLLLPPAGRPGGGERLAAALRRISLGEPHPAEELDTLQVEERIGFVFGAGMAVGFVEEARAHGRSDAAARWSLLLSVAASALVGGRLARRLHDKRRLRLSLDGEAFPPERYGLVLAGTVRELPPGLSALPRAGELPGTFHLVGYAATPRALPYQLLRASLGLSASPRVAIDGVGREAFLRSDRPLRYVLDGSVHEAGRELRLTLGPRLRIIVG